MTYIINDMDHSYTNSYNVSACIIPTIPVNKYLSKVKVLGQESAETLQPTCLFKNILAEQRRHARHTVDTVHVRAEVHLGVLCTEVDL